MKRIYKIYNIEKSEYGKSFTLCDRCFPKWKMKLPKDLLLEKIADKSFKQCNLCGR